MLPSRPGCGARARPPLAWAETAAGGAADPPAPQREAFRIQLHTPQLAPLRPAPTQRTPGKLSEPGGGLARAVPVAGSGRQGRMPPPTEHPFSGWQLLGYLARLRSASSCPRLKRATAALRIPALRPPRCRRAGGRKPRTPSGPSLEKTPTRSDLVVVPEPRAAGRGNDVQPLPSLALMCPTAARPRARAHGAREGRLPALWHGELSTLPNRQGPEPSGPALAALPGTHAPAVAEGSWRAGSSCSLPPRRALGLWSGPGSAGALH
uniref:tigger transposable element-derived protein 7 isoform X2 n=1 Tax=Ictidomys tridecemlineatus TaxID=43179 RepID=UPI001A9F5AC6|nr:tigger transposable element-derived protein 7 isoform X2 [Ictidomys tridecemlineatus]